MEEWRPVRSFEGYTISNRGRVRNEETGRIMALTRNQRGIYQVGLMRGAIQHKRSVTALVADTFLPSPEDPMFDTPIQLDGDRANNDVTNLLWRPRWFALKYRLQFHAPPKGFRHPVVEIETGLTFPTSWDAAIKYGLLDLDILVATINRTFVWPTGQSFRVMYR